MHFIDNQESFEVRLGRLEKRGSSFNQKMVDVLLSIDRVELSAKERIDTAILVAGDSDFVPAVQKAKNNGTRVILACSSDRNEYHLELWKTADIRIPIDEDRMRGCNAGNLSQ
ncbi:TIGR00288 family protein [Desulfacinum hydrothermale DSM 13146]|uniref:TIGR00288 family protein n=1 Tax=Desulfacinum hydrothermale DSM 13146 TaxID=1121390 RepID=A0A1W1X0A8_9BACT|nr:TIGR00288 family protein [Desulfacinum hydrothermale DSM 13146]